MVHPRSRTQLPCSTQGQRPAQKQLRWAISQAASSLSLPAGSSPARHVRSSGDGCAAERFTEAGEWARRSDQRQHKRAWDNSNPFPEPEAGEATTPDEGVSLNDFRAYMPTHSYIYMPTRDMWPGASVNARVPPVPMFNADGTPKLDNKGQQEFMSPARYLDDQKPVEQMTWAPGLPMLIPDRIISEGGWIERRGVTVFNLYRPLIIKHGDPRKAGPWLRLVIKVFGKKNARHIISWCAHRVRASRNEDQPLPWCLAATNRELVRIRSSNPLNARLAPGNCSVGVAQVSYRTI